MSREMKMRVLLCFVFCRYVADITFERLQERDMDPGTEHMLRVTNSVGTSEFSVKFDGGRRCECREASENRY